MTRIMNAGLCLLATTLVSCTTMPPVDLCQGAAVRRQVYVTTIAVADSYVASRRPVPAAVSLGREAALTALSILDLHCPQASR